MYRIIDANINRVCEGFRVLEDICRFKFDSEKNASKLKELRHKVRTISEEYEFKLIEYRDAKRDIGPLITKELNISRNKNIESLILANFKRVQEGLRSLEELTQNSTFERIRYNSYQLEKNVLLSNKKKKFTLPSLYGIIYSRDSLGRSNIEIVKEMIKGGIKLIQYREKDLSLKQMLEECIQIRELTTKADVLFIINDHIDISIIVNADGVHIGQDDLPINHVKNLIGKDKIIGVSTHSPEQALKAVTDGVDYIGVGPIHNTQTKEKCEPVGYSYLEWVSENISIPFVAIGGIKESNLHEVVIRKAKSIALVSEITTSSNIKQKIHRLNKIIKENTIEI